MLASLTTPTDYNSLSNVVAQRERQLMTAIEENANQNEQILTLRAQVEELEKLRREEITDLNGAIAEYTAAIEGLEKQLLSVIKVNFPYSFAFAFPFFFAYLF